MAILVQLQAVPQSQFNLFNGPTFVPTLATMLTLTAGTMFLVWIGELITENGVGNGISLIIFANIVASLPQTIGQTLVSTSGTGAGIDNGGLLTIGFTIALALAMTYVMVVVYMAQRRVSVRYPTKRNFYSGYRASEDTTYIPLQVNSAGMIPLIFASSILLLPVVIANFVAYSSNKAVSNFFSGVRVWLDSSNWYYWVIYGVLVFAFTYFYAIVIWQQGAFIPGIRPGPSTEEHLYNILKRITLGGAIFLGIVSIAPALLSTNQSSQVIQAASLLIVVGVVLDTVKQIEAQMVMRNYSGFLS
jgi:preprotein translocase subunit SecY